MLKTPFIDCGAAVSIRPKVSSLSRTIEFLLISTMSTWRRRFSRKSRRLNDNHELLLSNTLKYRKTLRTAIIQINRTRKSRQRNLDHPDSDRHIARLLNDIGQLSDCKSLQEVSSLIDSLAMRYQLSARIFNEYSMNSLEQSLEKLTEHLAHDFDQSKSVFEEAVTNHCSDHTKRQLFHKVQFEWSKHQQLAMKEFHHSLSSYCDIGLYHLRIQMSILEQLQNFIHQLPSDGDDSNNGLPNFAVNSQQTRKDIDTMLRVMLDSAPNHPSSLPNPQRTRSLTNQLTLSNIPHESTIVTSSPLENEPIANPDSLPSYTDLFVVPSHCKSTRIQRRSPRFQT